MMIANGDCAVTTLLLMAKIRGRLQVQVQAAAAIALQNESACGPLNAV